MLVGYEISNTHRTIDACLTVEKLGIPTTNHRIYPSFQPFARTPGVHPHAALTSEQDTTGLLRRQYTKQVPIFRFSIDAFGPNLTEQFRSMSV